MWSRFQKRPICSARSSRSFRCSFFHITLLSDAAVMLISREIWPNRLLWNKCDSRLWRPLLLRTGLLDVATETALSGNPYAGHCFVDAFSVVVPQRKCSDKNPGLAD